MIEKSASWPMAATQLSSPPPLLVCNHFFSSPSRLAWKIELDRSRTWWFYWAESPREFPVGEGGNVHPRHTQVCLGWVEPAQMPLPPLVFDASHPLAAPHIPGHPDVLRAPRFAFMLLRRPRGVGGAAPYPMALLPLAYRTKDAGQGGAAHCGSTVGLVAMIMLAPRYV